MRKIAICLLATFAISFSALPEARKVNFQGKKLGDDVFYAKVIPNIGAVAFSVPEDASNARPYIKGITNSASNSLIKGGNKPAVATNVGRRKIRKRRVSLSGNPKIKGKREFIDTAFLVKSLKGQAKSEYYYKKDRSLSHAIGSSSSYEIVVADGCKLTLKKGFKGYGILVLTGKSRNRKRLVMKSGAEWHGLIISDVGSDYKESAGAVIALGNKKAASLAALKIKALAGKIAEKIGALAINNAYAKRKRGGRPIIIGPLPPIGGGGSGGGSGNRAYVYGSVILAGTKPRIEIGYATVQYDKDAIKDVNEKMNSLKMVWQDWQEKED